MCPMYFQQFYTIWFGHLATLMILLTYYLDFLFTCHWRYLQQILVECRQNFSVIPLLGGVHQNTQISISGVNLGWGQVYFVGIIIIIVV